MVREVVKGIAFDFEGTTVSVEPVHHEAHLQSAREAGVYLTLDEAITKLPHFIGGPDLAVAEEIWNLSSGKHSVEYIYDLKRYIYEKLLTTAEIHPRPGFLDFLFRVKELGLPTTIGSSTPRERAMVLLERSGILALFPEDMIILKEDVHNEKPYPDVYLETAKRMGIIPENQLIFDDSPRGIRAAVAAGSRTIGMPVYREVVPSLINAGAERVYLNWQDINTIDFF